MVVLFANLLHNSTRRLVDRRVVLTHRVIPTTWRTLHHPSNISSWPMTMDQTQSSPSPSVNLVIHHTAQLRRLRKHTTECLKGRRNHLQRVELNMDPSQHPLTVPQSSWHPFHL